MEDRRLCRQLCQRHCQLEDSDNPILKSTLTILEGILILSGSPYLRHILFRRELHEGVKRNGVTGSFVVKKLYWFYWLEAFEEEGDTDNPIIHSDNNDVTDVRTRGISTSNRFRGASTVSQTIIYKRSKYLTGSFGVSWSSLQEHRSLDNIFEWNRRRFKYFF